jgi:hypothetical protein
MSFLSNAFSFLRHVPSLGNRCENGRRYFDNSMLALSPFVPVIFSRRPAASARGELLFNIEAELRIRGILLTLSASVSCSFSSQPLRRTAKLRGARIEQQSINEANLYTVAIFRMSSSVYIADIARIILQ